MPPHGQNISYGVSTSGPNPLKFTTVDVNPLVVYPGDTQTLKAVLTSTAGTIVSVQSETQLDTSVKTLNFIDDGTGTNTWTASWVVSDTHVDTYKTTFTATDSAGNSASIPFYWSDPCTGMSDAGNSTLTQASCTPATIDGVDDGNLTIGNGSTATNLLLGSGATFVINSGKSVTKAANGSITIPKGVGTSMTKGYLYYTDADNDGYPSATGAGNKSYTGTTTTTGKVRISTVVTNSRTVDPNDSLDTCQVNKYTDGDADGWCTSLTPTCVLSSAAGVTSCTSTSAVDCNDSAD
jgi:hypothetical protein